MKLQVLSTVRLVQQAGSSLWMNSPRAQGTEHHAADDPGRTDGDKWLWIVREFRQKNSSEFNFKYDFILGGNYRQWISATQNSDTQQKSPIRTWSKMIITLRTKKKPIYQSHVVLSTPKLNCNFSGEAWLYTQGKPPMQAGNKIAWTNPSNLGQNTMPLATIVRTTIH